MKGQIYSADFAISLVVFSIGTLIAFTMITNILTTDNFGKVNKQAITAADILNTPGYPEHWTNGSVVRAGLTSDGHLSLRKVSQLAQLSSSKLHQSLHVSDNVYVYITNQSNDTVGLFGTCGVGDLSVNSTMHNITLPGVVIANAVGAVGSKLAITQQTPSAAYTNLSSFDVLVIEGNLTSSISDAESKLFLEAVALRGVTIFVVGDPGFSVFGITTNTTAVTSIAPNADALGFTSGETIAVAANVPTIVVTGSAVSNFTTIATTDAGAIAYATWLYEDARVWYFGSAAGTAANGDVADLIALAVNGSVQVPWPICELPAPPNAKHIATHTRTMPFHDQLLTLHVLLWRDS
jgi:hypothetical protein